MIVSCLKYFDLLLIEKMMYLEYLILLLLLPLLLPGLLGSQPTNLLILFIKNLLYHLQYNYKLL